MWILAGIINNKIEENVKSKDIINLNDISDNSFVKIVNNVHNKNNENNLSSSQQFADHFQKRNKPKVIEVIDHKTILNKDIKDFLKKRKQKNDEEDILKVFFNEKEEKNNNNKIKEIPKKNPNFNFNFNRNKKQPIKYKEFIPLLKEDFKSNTYFDKLLNESGILKNEDSDSDKTKKKKKTRKEIKIIKKIKKII